MKKKKTNNQLTILEEAAPNKDSWAMGTFTWRERRPTEALINEICRRLIDFILNHPKPYTIQRFLFLNGLLENDYYKWQKDWPQLKKTHEYVKMGIGALREEKNIDGTFPTPSFMFVQPHYSSVWKEIVEWRNKLKNEEAEEKPTVVNLHMHNFAEKK